jgi:hypothetical protein
VGPHDVWNEKTMPKLQSLHIVGCPLVRRLPRGIEKVSKLHQIIGEVEWWQKLIWEDDNVKNNLSNLFVFSTRKKCSLYSKGYKSLQGGFVV